jgi:ketosteroid isomerase-like protein
MPTQAENLEIVIKGYKDYDEDNWDAVWECIHPEFEFQTAGALFDPELIEGLPGYQAFIDRIHDRYEHADINDREIVAADGEDIVVFTNLRTVEKSTGDEKIQTVGWVWTMKDGTVYRGQEYLDHDEARQAAGLA